MKKIILITFYLWNTIMFAQISSSFLVTPVEIYLLAKNSSNPNGTTIFTMQAVSTVWGGNSTGGSTPEEAYLNSYTWLSNDYDFMTYEAINDEQVHSGFEFVASNDWNAPMYGYGKYKLSVGDSYFYLDYRDDYCGYYPPLETTGHPIDMWIKYDHDNNTFNINSYSGNPTDPHWVVVENNGDIKSIWELKGIGERSTDKFEPYPPQNLSITLDNGKPKLTWQHRSPADDYWKGYKIYRCITVNNEPPTNFVEIATVGEYTTTFTDNSLCFANWKNIHYKVKTKNILKDSDYSNEVQISLTEEIINCNLNFTSDLTVPSGKTLKINPGVTLTFSNGASLVVNGTLNAIGTSVPGSNISLTSTSVDWGGIRFNSGSSGTLDYCNIINASTGIYLYNSSPLIKHSTIDDCSSIGIFCDYYSSPRLIGNNIRLNDTYGLRCNSYSSPNLTDYGYPGLNVIRDNESWGINVTYNCNPNLNGYGTSGNSVFYNASCNVRAENQCIVYAQRVWWGQYPPNYYMFCEGASSTIDWSNPLQSNPNPGRRIESPEITDKEPIHVTMSIQIDELELAEQYQNEGKYDEAINLFLEVFKKEMNTSRGRYALIKIEECFTQTKMKDFIDFSRKELRPLFKEENELFVVLLELETHQLYNLGFDDQAMNNLKMILNKYNFNEAIEKQTLYRIGAFYLDIYNDKVSAQKTFDDLAAKYPDDELLRYANQMLNEDRFNSQKSFNQNFQTIDEVKSREENLSNYPNPFNPTTKILFTLSSKDNVKLKVFDVLGREVALLVDGVFEIGSHEIIFNASELPSGVYFYNLTTSTNSITRKMLLIK